MAGCGGKEESRDKNEIRWNEKYQHNSQEHLSL